MNNISPLDGRYSSKLAALADACGESALSKYRVLVELEYFLHMSKLGIKGFKVSASEEKILRNILPLKDADIQIIKDIEFKGYKHIKPTNHDVKAIEYFLKDVLGPTSLKNRLEWIHFALTSEDVNSVSYALLIREGIEKVLLPKLLEIQKVLDGFSKKYAALPMLARTHGQAAVGTTFGKEFRVFERRLDRQIKALQKLEISCKFGGAVGNFNAHMAAFENIDWQKGAQKFIAGFNKNYKIKIFLNPVSTQSDPHDTYAEAFDNIRRVNMILLDFCQDMWRYISDDWVKQRPVEGEVGSSTMPQKVNPIDFENAEGNFGLANALYNFFSTKLPVSRLQRDLSDSTVCRNFAVAFGYSLVAYNAVLKGMGKVEVNEAVVKDALNARPEVLAEAVQTILRAEAVPNAYELLKGLTRGKKITKEGLDEFISKLDVKTEVKNKLKKITALNYLGIAADQARNKK